MPLSARNRLTGTVTDVTMGDVVAEVRLELGDGQQMTALITAASVERLGIEPGEEIEAVVKATNVMIEV